MNRAQKKVFVGLSGGVDSSVAALRLLRQGYAVYGVFIKVWHPDFLQCNWEKERLDAMRVAAKLGIPFLTCDAVEAYKNDVADYFIGEYKKGRTPNPDVMCNKFVKFGKFLDFAQKHGADYIATGHYAQILTHANGNVQLHRGIDTQKDQSYFLWNIPCKDLKSVLLPIGDSPKATIRAEAQSAGLVTAQKKDSQGICFLGHVDIPQFLSNYIDLKEGDVLDNSGTVVGRHKGALVYTKGQRHGFVMHTKTHEQGANYVISRNIAQNTITVSTSAERLRTNGVLTLGSCNFFEYTPRVGETVEIETRYHQKPSLCRIKNVEAGTVTLSYVHSSEAPTEGQSCVLYAGTQCLGGGIIETICL